MIDKYKDYIIRCFESIPTSISVGMLLVFCFGAVVFLVILGYKKGIKWTAGLILFEYLYLIIVLAVLSRNIQMNRSYDFTPFWSYRAVREGRLGILTQIIANVTAFIPIGLLLGFAFSRIKWWNVVLIGSVFSVLIETLQLMLKKGFAEFDDVWHNVVGCMIGYGVYLGMACLIKRLTKKRQPASEVLMYNLEDR